MDYYSAIKIIMLSKKSQVQGNTICRIPFKCNLTSGDRKHSSGFRGYLNCKGYQESLESDGFNDVYTAETH